jgi:hypothetical protein
LTAALTRFPDWPQRLSRAIHERRDRQHAWGQNDCALFTADLVAAVTGQDFAKPFRGTYRSESGARRMLAAHGWPDLEAMVDQLLPRRVLERPRRGDIGLKVGDFGPFLGVFWQGGIIGPGPERAIVWPATDILACWSVG